MSKDSINSLDMPSHVKKSIVGIESTINSFEYKLLFNNNRAKFNQVEKLNLDSDNILTIKLAKITTGIRGNYFYDFNKKALIREVEDFEELVLVQKVGDYNWILKKETKKINGSICYKAILKKKIETRSRGVIERNLVAWYDPSINIPFGPDGYYGLPGLIVELNDGKVTTYLIKIDYRINPSIEFPHRGRVMTEDEYNSYLKENVSKGRETRY